MTQQTPLSDRWLEYAQRDLDVAKHLQQHFQPTPYEIICYQCQQAAEKALKALYIALAIPGGIPRTHDLSLLLDQMRRSVSISDDIYDLADELTPYDTAARYPGDLFFDAGSTQTALTAAEQLLAWARSQFI